MNHTILQITLTYEGSEAELEAAFSQAVDAIATFPGLTWKIWIVNDVTQEAGGIYCFVDEPALNAYVNSPIVAALKMNPLVRTMQIKSFDAIASLTRCTRGPVPCGLPSA